mgnify:CR=1 FL=1
MDQEKDKQILDNTVTDSYDDEKKKVQDPEIEDQGVAKEAEAANQDSKVQEETI